MKPRKFTKVFSLSLLDRLHDHLVGATFILDKDGEPIPVRLKVGGTFYDVVKSKSGSGGTNSGHG